MQQKKNWNNPVNAQRTVPQRNMVTRQPQSVERINLSSNERATERPSYKKKVKSWRYLSFFKKNGLLIKFGFAQQTIYLSFIKKTTDTKYQSFTDGFVVKLSLEGLNELLYCLSLQPPQQWDTWREKNGEKYHVFVIPIPLQEFTLMSGSKIALPATALHLKVQHKSEVIHGFTLSPSEANLILDAFQKFRDQVIHNIIMNRTE